MKTLTTKDFKRFYTKNFKKKFYNELIIHYAKSNYEQGRIGISISTKLKLNAVRRNLQKRWIKETLKDYNLGYDINFLVIKEFNSLEEASKALKIALKSIS